MVAMNVQGKIMNNKPATVMVALVWLACISSLSDIIENLTSYLFSKLHMGSMECMGNMLRNLWWGHTREKQINNTAIIVWWQ